MYCFRSVRVSLREKPKGNNSKETLTLEKELNDNLPEENLELSGTSMMKLFVKTVNS